MKLPHFLKSIEGKSLSFLLLIIVVLFGYYFYAIDKDEAVPVIVEVNAVDHIRGNQNGKVTLVEFGDFQCPACGAYEPIMQKLVSENSDLKLVFRHFPLFQIHKNAMLSARASESAALQGKFWEMHDMLYANQGEWSNSLNVKDLFISYAQKLNLDIVKFNEGLESKEIEDKILAEYKEGVRLQVQATPSFFLNGQKIDNPTSFEGFDKVIKEAVKANSNQ